MRKSLLLLAALSACHSTPKNDIQTDGPFGIIKGEQLAALGTSKQIKPDYYQIVSVPHPYPNIKYYIVKNTPKSGTCRIQAISNDMASDGSGNIMRDAMAKVKADLVSRYGDPTDTNDTVTKRNILPNSEDWMLALSKTGSYYFNWIAPKNADSKIWHGVEAIGLTASSQDGTNGRFTIEYFYDWNSKCGEAAEAL